MTNPQTFALNGPATVTANFSVLTRYGTPQIRTFTWSGKDLVSTTNPETGTVTYTYDAAHRVQTRTDAKGQQTQYDYDSYGRLAEVRHYTLQSGVLAEILNQRWDYHYDTNPVDPSFTQNGWGRLTAVQYGGQDSVPRLSQPMVYQYSYNVAGRVQQQKMSATIACGSVYCQDYTATMTAQYGWDNEGRMTTMTYPAGASSFTATTRWGTWGVCRTATATAAWQRHTVRRRTAWPGRWRRLRATRRMGTGVIGRSTTSSGRTTAWGS